MAGRHRLKIDRRPLYRWILATSSASILAANFSVIPTDQPSPPTPTPTPVIAITTHTPLPSTTSVTTPPPPPITTPPPPPVITTTTTPPPPTKKKKTTPPPPPPEPTSEQKARIADEPDECSTELAGTKEHVAQAGQHIRLRFGLLESIIGGLAPRANKSDHPLGLALDFSVNRITGDQIAEYALDNAELLSVKYVIWRQRIRFPGGDWKRMEDRGSATANHYDHVHISFLPEETGHPTC